MKSQLISRNRGLHERSGFKPRLDMGPGKMLAVRPFRGQLLLEVTQVWAAKYCFVGCKWPTGRKFETLSCGHITA